MSGKSGKYMLIGDNGHSRCCHHVLGLQGGVSMTESMRLAYNEALTAYKDNPTEENRTRLNEAKAVILIDISNRWLEQNKVFERQQ